MIHHKLCNIVLDTDERTEKFPGLFYNSSSIVLPDSKDGSSKLAPYSKFDFGTYFNACSISKWRTYASVDNLHLRIEAKGKAEFVFYTVTERVVGLERTIVGRVSVDSDEFIPVDFAYPESGDELAAFWVTTFDSANVRNGFYYTEVDESRIRPVHIAIATTTFRHEDYIAKNVKLFKDEIASCSDPIGGNISMIVVDNGQTLEHEAIAGDSVHVFSNENVGGAGGFARGMIEAQRLYTPVTHVLVMDDDIELSSESVKRTFNLLSLVNEDYVDAFVSGAMFSLVDQARQHEDIGRINAQGRHGGIKQPKRMDCLENVFHNEDPLPTRGNLYAAFWYCCIPMATIREKGLPLPIFIRFDDAEYGMRCKPKFMSMNGINVWHSDFDDRYNTFYERYCLMRNFLIIQAASGVCSKIDFMEKVFEKHFRNELQKLNYPAAEMLLDAVDDFLKGPEFIMEPKGEAILKEMMPKAEKFVDLSELKIGNVSMAGIDAKDSRTPRQRRIDDLTFNGQRYVLGRFRNNKLVAIRFRPDAHPGQRIHFRRKILVVDWSGKRGALRKSDRARFNAIMAHYKRTMRDFRQGYETVKQAYAEAQPVLTSVEFWKKYLGID